MERMTSKLRWAEKGVTTVQLDYLTPENLGNPQFSQVKPGWAIQFSDYCPCSLLFCPAMNNLSYTIAIRWSFLRLSVSTVTNVRTCWFILLLYFAWFRLCVWTRTSNIIDRCKFLMVMDYQNPRFCVKISYRCCIPLEWAIIFQIDSLPSKCIITLTSCWIRSMSFCELVSVSVLRFICVGVEMNLTTLRNVHTNM